jgi:hypothetical protein
MGNGTTRSNQFDQKLLARESTEMDQIVVQLGREISSDRLQKLDEHLHCKNRLRVVGVILEQGIIIVFRSAGTTRFGREPLDQSNDVRQRRLAVFG